MLNTWYVQQSLQVAIYVDACGKLHGNLHGSFCCSGPSVPTHNYILSTILSDITLASYPDRSLTNGLATYSIVQTVDFHWPGVGSTNQISEHFT